MQAHIISGVVMDIAAFKISHAAGSDIDATTLQAEKARSASMGAMDASSGTVRDASTQKKRCCHGYCSLQSLPRRRKLHRRHHPASRESKVSLHRGDGGNVWEGSKCKHLPSVMPKS